jgi:ABC-type nitrate/sulfonate/bicarbonate transport system substrate-binding protein
MTRAVTQSGQKYFKAILGSGIAAALILIALPLAAYMKWVDWAWLGPSEKLRLAAYEGDVGALEWIARDMGFYEATGIEVDIKGFASGKEAVDALRAGQVDVATASEFVVAAEGLSRPDLRILTSVSHYRNKGIVGRRDRGIVSPADLKGKRIGVTVPSGAEYSLSVFLALNQMTTKDVTVVNLAPREIADAVAAGRIDAAITWQPHVQAIETALGANAASFSGDSFDVYLLLVTQVGNVAGNERALTRFLRALLRAESWVHDHPAEARAYVTRRFGLDAAQLDAQWPRMELALSLSQGILVAMDSQARWLARHQGRPDAAIPNFAHFIRADELKSVKPAAVTVLSQLQTPPRGLFAAITGH